MPVGVDDRVRQPGADLRGARHATTPSSRAHSSSLRAVATCAMWTSWPSPWFASPWMHARPGRFGLDRQPVELLPVRDLLGGRRERFVDDRDVLGVAHHHPEVADVAQLAQPRAEAVEIVVGAAPHAADRVADAGRACVDQHLLADVERLAALARPAEAERRDDVAEARDRAAHVRDSIRRGRDLVRAADRGRVLEDRVQHRRPDGEAVLGLETGEDRVGGMDVGRTRDLREQHTGERARTSPRRGRAGSSPTRPAARVRSSAAHPARSARCRGTRARACGPARGSLRCTACAAPRGRGTTRRRPTPRCRRCAAPDRPACRAATGSASRRLAPCGRTLRQELLRRNSRSGPFTASGWLTFAACPAPGMRTSSVATRQLLQELLGLLHRDRDVGLAVEHDRGRGDLGQPVGDVVATRERAERLAR